MAGLLETLDFNAEVKDSNHHSASRRLENFCQPSSQWVPFSNKAGKDRGIGTGFHMLYPRYDMQNSR